MILPETLITPRTASDGIVIVSGNIIVLLLKVIHIGLVVGPRLAILDRGGAGFSRPILIIQKTTDN